MIRPLAIMAVLVLAAPPAPAQEPPPPASEEMSAMWGRVVVLQEFIAGRFRDVVKSSREVEIIRAGVEFQATPGFVLRPEDAIRTRGGRVVVERPDGGRVSVRERSQVRLDPEAGWLHRLGTLDAVLIGPDRFTAGEVVIDSADADLRLTRTLAGDGEITVLRGAATITIGGGEAIALAPGTGTIFTQETITATAPLAPEVLAALHAERDAAPGSDPVQREPAKAHLRISGGISRIHGADFGRVGVSARIRLAGPLFVALGGNFGFRPVDEDLSIDAAFVVPAHVGVRLVVPLPRAFMLLGGLDFTAFVGEWCAGAGCTTDVVAEPGARLLVGTGIEIAEVLGIDITFSGGVIRRAVPASIDPSAPVVPELQLHLGLGVYFRL